MCVCVCEEGSEEHRRIHIHVVQIHKTRTRLLLLVAHDASIFVSVSFSFSILCVTASSSRFSQDLAFDFYPRAQCSCASTCPPLECLSGTSGRSKRKGNLRLGNLSFRSDDFFWTLRSARISSRFRNSPFLDGHSRKKRKENRKREC